MASKRRMRGGRRDALIDHVAEVLDLGFPSKWRLEGTCRFFLRRRFILQRGWSWDRSDREAIQIVHAALWRIGVRGRPSWADSADGMWEWLRLHPQHPPVMDIHSEWRWTPSASPYDPPC